MIEIDPVSIETLLYANELFGKAATDKIPGINPKEKSFQIGNEQFSFTNNPMNKGIMALTKEFKGHQGMIIGIRLFALLDLINDPLFKSHVKEGQVSEPLITAAATAKFNGPEIDMGSVESILEEWVQ